MHVFIVENHADTRELLAMYLEGMGHTVRSVSTMADALRTLPGTECDVLISDIGLPDGNGWELLQKLPEPKPAYTIAMTGFGMSADQIKSREAGFRRHLLKPFSPDELDQALDEAAREMSVRV